MSTHTSPHQTGVTPVYIAAQTNHVEALELLIKANADVNKATQVRERLPKTAIRGERREEKFGSMGYGKGKERRKN